MLTATPVPLDSSNSRLHRKQIAAALNQASLINVKVSSKTDANTAAVTQEIIDRTTADSALAETLTTLDATVVSGLATANAAISSELIARVNGDNALAASIVTLSATVTSNNTTTNAAISTEQTARANADTAIASSVTSLTATVNSNDTTQSAAVTTEATARATADGNIMADYSIQVSTLNNGKKALAGLKLIAGANQSSEIDVIASKFAVYENVGGTTIGGPVFTVSGGNVNITGALYAGSISTDQLTVGGVLITGAMLANNSVSTTTIAANNVTKPFSKVWVANQGFGTGGTTLWTVNVTTVDSATALVTVTLYISWSGASAPTFALITDGVSTSLPYSFSGPTAGQLVITSVTVPLSGSGAHTIVLQGTASGTPSDVLPGSSATAIVCQR